MGIGMGGANGIRLAHFLIRRPLPLGLRLVLLFRLGYPHEIPKLFGTIPHGLQANPCAFPLPSVALPDTQNL